MTEGDDKLGKAWRELGSEEPPTRIDAAILNASRQAVAPRRASQRWAVPVSLAAVLVLAVGVTLRMQQEQPGIETSMPLREEPPAAAPVPPMQAPAGIAPLHTLPPPKPEKQGTLPGFGAHQKLERAPPSPQAFEEKGEKKAVAVEQRMDAPVSPAAPKPVADAAPRAKPAAPPPAAPATRVEAAPPAGAPPVVLPPSASGSFEPREAAPQPMPLAKTQAAPAAANRAAAGATASVAAPAVEQARAKRDSSELAADGVKEAEKGPLERELERIARLRREGRQAEADEALAKFRREHPDYRIPDAVWEQVKPR
jgi:hypothetical protein